MTPFEDHVIEIDTVFGLIGAHISAEALHVLHRDHGGPRDTEDLITAHLDMLSLIATMIFEAGKAIGAREVEIEASDLRR